MLHLLLYFIIFIIIFYLYYTYYTYYYIILYLLLYLYYIVQILGDLPMEIEIVEHVITHGSRKEIYLIYFKLFNLIYIFNIILNDV